MYYMKNCSIQNLQHITYGGVSETRRSNHFSFFLLFIMQKFERMSNSEYKRIIIRGDGFEHTVKGNVCARLFILLR